MPPARLGRIGASVFATLLAAALSIAPFTAPPALAGEGPLRTEAEAVYTVDPETGRVHVEIDVTETNLKPSTATVRFFYISFGFALQPEARNVRVSGGSAYRVTTRKRDRYVEAIVHVSRSVNYRQSSSFTIRYDLVGGAPRSTSPIRVGAAFATFDVWAWGDPGRGRVEVRTPDGFLSEFDGGPFQKTTTPTRQYLFAEPDDPARFYAIVRSENRAAYTEERISFDGGVELVVQGWPEDEAWGETVGSTLRDGVPELLDLIGLEWPVDHDLRVLERYTPALEGYAGVFLTREERIEVSEDLDPVVIVHEVSHAWFNEDLFTDRWIYEGLAQDYAWRTLTAIGMEAGPLPDEPSVFEPGWQALLDWEFPEVIRDQDTDDDERYGYEASFWVMHAIVEAVGIEQMTAAFTAAQANHTAYPGAGAPETVAAADDWRRFLDLVQPLDRPDPPGLDEALGTYVGTGIERQQIAMRAAARAKYRALLEAGEGWLPPWTVRALMGGWSFIGATSSMDAAMAVLDLRDEVDAAAEPLGLDPDGALRAAYEGASDGLTGATAIARDQLDSLAAIAAAKGQVEATPDFITQLGLLGEAPRAPYDAARDAFESGELAEATRLAGVAAALITGAAAVGQVRLLVAVAMALAVVLLLFALLWLRRRGRRRALDATAILAPALDPAAAPDPAAGLASVPDPASVPAPGLASGTLAADPAAAPPQPGASAPDSEGAEPL
jgi:hypothetical protein